MEIGVQERNVRLHSRIANQKRQSWKLVAEPPVMAGLGFDSLYCDGAHRRETAVGQARGVMAKTVTIKEKEGEVAFVEEGHDVERVTVILKNCYEKKYS